MKKTMLLLTALLIFNIKSYNSPKEEVKLEINCNPGFIYNKDGVVKYYLKGSEFSFYNISLVDGVYIYKNVVNNNDTLKFTVGGNKVTVQ